MVALQSTRPFGNLFERLKTNVGDIGALQQAAQLALQVEFATIPVYLSGMYSIVDTSSDAFQALRSVVMEEMFHLNQAANLVIGLGALPRFTGQAAPHYPGYLPHANEASTPLLGLYRASSDVFANVYSAIEAPAPPGAPPQGSQYDSIAQLYAALWDGIEAYPGDPFANPAADGRQRTDIYLGKFGGTVFEVVNRLTAKAGITQIVKQGEGSVPKTAPLVETEPFGAYNHYGDRSDGTYGPILGTPLELSHFSKFRKIAVSMSAFPATLPAMSNPEPSSYTNRTAMDLDKTFNLAYSLMLRGFEHTFMRSTPDPYFGLVLNMMHDVLPALALALMNTPAFENGDPSVGPNAAPSWRYVEHAHFSDLNHRLHTLAGHSVIPDALATALTRIQGAIQRMPAPLVASF